MSSGFFAVSGISLEMVVPILRIDGELLTSRLLAVKPEILDPVLVRIQAEGELCTSTSEAKASYRMTYDFYQTRNVHIYSRVEFLTAGQLTESHLPSVDLGANIDSLTLYDNRAREVPIGPGMFRLGESWVMLKGRDKKLGLIFTKLPWHSKWNEVGAYDSRTLQDTNLCTSRTEKPRLSLVNRQAIQVEQGETLESKIIFRINPDGYEDVRNEATHLHEAELAYSPAGEFARFLTWEVEDGWLGPPILGGCPQYPPDQLIRRPLGLDVLARKRFNLNNEDFSMWHLTGKERYWDSGIKKAYALMADQTPEGGWYEGINFYNLPPSHYQMYDTYFATTFLFDAYDATGFQKFLDAACNVKRFWGGKPPANSYTKDAEDAYWYRWGGYVDKYGNTDERHVLNTHAGALMNLAMLYERTGDTEALDLLRKGVNAFRAKLPLVQKPDGQLLYALSQRDPSLERESDPPYLMLNLVPQIEDVYTLASSYRLMIANRVAKDPVITEAVRKALTYWWKAYREGRAVTYRYIPVFAYALAAGEIDLSYAMALPLLLKNPDFYTSIQRGFSSMTTPYRLKGLHTRVNSFGPHSVETVFVRRTEKDFLFAVVNTEHALSGLGIEVWLEEQQGLVSVTELCIEGTEKNIPFKQEGRTLRFDVDTIRELDVKVFKVHTDKTA